MKVRLFLLALCGMIVLSCSHGQLSTLPEIDKTDEVAVDGSDESKVDGSDKAAEVFIIRKGSILGAAISYKVALDDQDIVTLKNGSHTSFKVNPGPHQLSFTHFRLIFGWTGPTTDFDFSANQTYYILIKPGMVGITSKILTEEKARKYLKKTEYLELDQ